MGKVPNRVTLALVLLTTLALGAMLISLPFLAPFSASSPSVGRGLLTAYSGIFVALSSVFLKLLRALPDLDKDNSSKHTKT